MRITLRNEFHNSKAVVLAPITELDDHNVMIALSTRQARVAERKLCGIKSCMCGGRAGTRGRQMLPDGRTILVETV